jgi:hypothetical protein
MHTQRKPPLGSLQPWKEHLPLPSTKHHAYKLGEAYEMSAKYLGLSIQFNRIEMAVSMAGTRALPAADPSGTLLKNRN